MSRSHLAKPEPAGRIDRGDASDSDSLSHARGLIARPEVEVDIWLLTSSG